MKWINWIVFLLILLMIGYIFGKDKIPTILTKSLSEQAWLEVIWSTWAELDTSDYKNYSLDDLKNIFQNSSWGKAFDPVANWERTNDIKDLYIVIDYFINQYQYDKASKYFEVLITKTNDRDRAKFMDILINNFDWSPAYYKKVRQLLEGYKSWSTISMSDYYFFDLTLDLLHGNYQQNKLNNLTDKYIPIRDQFWAEISNADKYKDVPNYYKLGMLTMVYFKNNYFGVAKNISDYLISQNPKYILPYQIKAYIGLTTNRPDIAITQLNALMDLDSDNMDYYQQLLGISYYAKGDYITAANHFLQVKYNGYIEDKTRFLIDIYRKQKDDNKVANMYYEQIKLWLKPVDFQWFFDWFIYDRLEVTDTWFEKINTFYQINKDLYVLYLKKCIDIASKSADFKNVCDYGQAGHDLVNNDYDQSLKKLLLLLEKYPDSQVYYTIGRLYMIKWEDDKAKKYLIHAIITSKDNKDKNSLKNMLLEMVSVESNTTSWSTQWDTNTGKNIYTWWDNIIQEI